MDSERFFFLFRQDQGTIDRRTWGRATLALAAVFAVFVALQTAFSGRAHAVRTGVGSLFVIAAMIIGASYYFLSAKRFRGRGRPPALAIVLPAALFACAVVTLVQPANGGLFPVWITYLADLALLGVVAWNVIELGLRP